MTQPYDPIQQAADRYHACCSDAAYKAIQRAVITDLYGPVDTPDWEPLLAEQLSQSIPSHLMNALTDAAREICRWPGFEGGLLRLAQALVVHHVGWATIQLIGAFLQRFEAPQQTSRADLLVTVQAAQFLLKAQPVLHEAAASAGDIHTARGRAAHDLLVAAHALTRAAQLLLSGEDDLSYIAEKVLHATDRIVRAQQEDPLTPLR